MNLLPVRSRWVILGSWDDNESISVIFDKRLNCKSTDRTLGMIMDIPQSMVDIDSFYDMSES